MTKELEKAGYKAVVVPVEAYISRSMAEDRNNEHIGPRTPRDIKGLLKFCMEATRNEDAPGTSSFETMPEERKKWLEDALTSMSVSPVERMLLCVKMIQEAEEDTEDGTEQQIKAVTELQDWGEDMDIANDFIKINGMCIVPKLLGSEVSELRWRCLELLGTLAQNNPFVQNKLISLKLMPALLTLVDTDPNPTVRVKAMYAVSCLVRSNHAAQAEFVAGGGLKVLLNAVANTEEKLRIKGTFLMTALCEHNPGLRDTLTSDGAVQLLIKLLKEKEHCNHHEHLMSALLNLVTDNAAARALCLDETVDLKTFLCSRIRLLTNKDEFMEEREYADKLLQILNADMESGSQQQSASNMAVLPV
ncbi:hypothetical protein RRG08_058252 [Elysia crispata]|uniref:Nucleotide exchange factor Fes1 domain-containing protein n=1 Tax=Elysia crispata TaxID=231223 RepID=A0AAE0YVL5_9GAST|nr:hypothetical protein RRG08_058252 [Elysia crispata]